MIKFLILGFFVIFTAHAAPYKIHAPQNLSLEEGASLLKSHVEASLFLGTNSFTLDKGNNKAKDNSHINGDFIILWGVGSNATDQQITKTEYQNMWRIMDYLNDLNFRVIMNVRSTSSDLATALQSSTASVVLYSSHGNETGFYDYNLTMVPYSIFKKLGPKLYQFILSACYGTQSLEYYEVPEHLYTLSWSGLTDSTDLINYLTSNHWTGLEGKENLKTEKK
ncbi:hypothetical protein ACJVC5_10470 [Peredibacter sp. HCB2-198]|uniref:hypothetical protein n=1 Tax=Peredibacter sp. HCB2-198 TaxID=3383025 RepID=UPI0038B68B86